MHLTVEAKIDNIVGVTKFVNEQLRSMGCSRRALTQINVALDELFSNVCRYAYPDDTGFVTIHVNELPEENAVSITLEDAGKPFDPLSRKDPDITLGLHERGIGGLGIFIVKKTMNDVRYEHRDGLNVLTVTKTL